MTTVTILLMINDMRGPKSPFNKQPKTNETEVEDDDFMVVPEDGSPDTLPIDPVEKPPKAKSKRRFHIWPEKWSTKKKRLCTAALVAVLLVAAGAGYYFYKQANQPTKAAVVATKTEPPKPTTEASRLTGLQVDPAANQRVVTGVMIENSPDARPQSGLGEAGFVFEAVAEGGITRFLALYQEAQPASIGPIRSARPYYLDWVLPFNATYAHVGGSPEALAQIKSLGVRDLDQFANSGSYERISTRYAPHNVYSSAARLYDLAQKKGYTSSTFTSLPRKTEAPATPTARTIDLSISGPLYNPHYDYDATTNTYKRSEGGKPHMEQNNGAQLSPKVVIALVMPSAIAADGTHNSYTTTGSNTAFIFQDGVVTQGTWKKDSRTAQFVFSDAAGQPIKLNPGQTWVSMVNAASSVVYTP